MLILLLRVVFVLLCVTIGRESGRYFYEGLFDNAMPDWFGAPLGFSVGVTLVAAEHAFRHRFTRFLVAFLLGLAGGLLLSWLLMQVLALTLSDTRMVHNLNPAVTLVITYLVVITVLRHADRFRLVLPFVEFRADRIEDGALVLDASALRDGRLLALVQAGIAGQRLIVHRELLQQLEQQAGQNDTADGVLARKALEHLAALRALGTTVAVQVEHAEIPGALDQTDTLLGLARLESARLVTTSPTLASRARGEGVGVVLLHDLADAFSPRIAVGENIRVTIEKAGDSPGQGVGHLDDGSLVIIENAAGRVGQTVRADIIRLHQTSSGRMVFARLSEDNDGRPRGSGRLTAPPRT